MTGRGVVAAGHRLTAEAGAQVLRDGGTAIDAAIAAVTMACVSEPVLCSPGGGGFAMLRDGRTGLVSLVDFFAHTPLASRDDCEDVREVHADFGTATQRFHIGPATSATPGFFAGLAAIHAAGATASLDDLFAPAIAAARVGIAVTPFQHHLAVVVGAILCATDGSSDLFAPAGEVMASGGTFRNPGLADALEIMAADGFAAGAVGAACIEQQRGRGHLTTADLAAYEAVERAPLSIDVGGATVHLNPLPAASGVLIAHSLAQLADTDPPAIARAFQATNVARRAASARPDGLAELAAATVRTRGTTHVSVVDAAGSACAVTVSNGEGNGEIVDGFGFMLNNILGEDDVNPVGATGWPTDTRLSSMMCPTLIDTADGGLVALGTGGSNRIRSAISQVVLRLCRDGVRLDEAVAAPRLHVEGVPGHLDFEDAFDDSVRAALCADFPDHRAWSRPDLFFGGVHAVQLAGDGSFTGAGDARRDGVAIVVG